MDQERYESSEVMDARERVADDVSSIAYNANVVERTKEAASNKIDDAKEMIGSAGMRMREVTVENPMTMLLAGMAVGFLIGMLLPVSRFESERIGPVADQMKDRMREAGSEAMRRGSEVIKDTIDAGTEAAKASMRSQASGMSSDDTSSMT